MIEAHQKTKNQVVDWETGILNMEDILENLRDGVSLRLNSLEKGHLVIWPKKNSKARVNRLRWYIVRDGGKEPWVQKMKMMTKMERITEEEYKKSFLKNQLNTRWVFVITSRNDKEARY